MRDYPTNSDNVIDSRAVIKRIEELEQYKADAQEAREGEPSDTANNETLYWSDDFTETEHEELLALQALADEASGSPDWKYGETLIRDSYFEEYAQELAEDIGAVNKDQSWPNNCIDWEEAADQLKQDYMSVDFDGVEYWIRA